MADQPLSIILDYLRQHKFSRAEKALLSELQDREEAPSGAADSSDSECSAREEAEGSQNVNLKANGEVRQMNRSETNRRSSGSDIMSKHGIMSPASTSRPGHCDSPQVPEVSSMSASYDFSQLHSGFQGTSREQGSASAAGRVQHDVEISIAGSDKARSSNSDPTELRHEQSVHHLNIRRSSLGTLHNDDTDDVIDQRKRVLQYKNASEAFCEDDAHHFGSGFHEVEDPDAENCADSAYSAPLRNGWLDYCGPDDMAIDALKVSECYSHECEDSLSDVELQQEKLAMKQSAEARKCSGIQLVNESHLPWENVLPNSVEEAEEFLDSQPEELRSVILDKSRCARNEKGLAKPNHEGYEFDKMFHSDNQVEELRSIILSKSRYAKELGSTNGNNAGFDFDKMFHSDNQGYANSVFDHTFNLGSFLEIPVGQGLTLPGERHGNGSCKISMSQDILEDSPELLSGFATLGDEPSESAIGYPKHYWDSDTYDDEDDPGYHRQPIEDEVWFLAHEIDYPSEDERVVSNNDKEPCQGQNDQDISSALNDPQQSYLSGEQIGNAAESTDQDMLAHDILNITNLFGKSSLNDVLTLKQIGNMSYDGQLMDAEELKLMGAEPVWQGYSSQKHVNQAEDIQQELDIKDSSPFSSPIVESYSALHHEASAAYANDAANLAAVEDEDATALQEELEQMKLQEDDYEVFNLRIVHRKNRTGFEEEKHFPVVINSVVAGRYLITEYLGSAAFSKAVQARDLQTGMDVCIKIIKNNKDFFDQSLDEIKLLKFINRHDPADNHHILRLYDYFYYREHLFLVCELLRANLYEFHKFNRESGGEAYFTMPRLQSIARQCLEALEFLHGLGLIHCDLKPENILIKSYSRCEVKVIDLGSSCFQTDNLCSYVQSRSYRAPEVILGLPYDQKIDTWSLGCILAELCSGVVLFQNDSLATLLARVVGIIGPIMPEMISKGRESHKYFTKNFMIYERNQATSKLEYLVPKKTSLRHRLPTGDQGFVDFVGYLLQINPDNRPSASEALKHPWLTYPYEPILT